MAALYPGVTYPGESDAYPGGTEDPDQYEVLYSTDAATDTDPSWTYVPAAKFISYGADRGRETEREEVDAGTCSINLRNHERDWDPTFNALIRPMNRWWVRIKRAGVTYDRYVGYADRYDLSWPEAGKESRVTVQCRDEQKPLNLDRLRVTDPPRDTYADVIQFDVPTAYWRMITPDAERVQEAAVGKALVASGSVSELFPGPILGEPSNSVEAISLPSVETLSTGDLAESESGEMGGLAEITVECWFYASGANPAGTRNIIVGPQDATTRQWRLRLNTTGTVAFTVRNSSPADVTATSSISLTSARWYHIVGTITSANVRLYIDGIEVATTAWSGVVSPSALTAGVSDVLFGDTAGTGNFSYDEVALYRTGLTASRIQAHYAAGSRGFLRNQTAGVRAAAILDSVGSTTPRSLQAGSRAMVGRRMTGQSPLEELRQAERAEAPNGFLFVSKSGVITLLADDHRSASPYNTVQATFDDDGTDLSYLGLDVDYSESFLFNDWNVSTSLPGPPRALGVTSGGLLQTVSDSASIAQYGKRSQSITDLPILADSVANTIAAAMLAKYKDPFQRVTGLAPNMSNAAVAAAVLALDLGAKIRVIRRPIGGGSAIDQSPWVQKIHEEGKPGEPLTVKLSVSPV